MQLEQMCIIPCRIIKHVTQINEEFVQKKEPHLKVDRAWTQNCPYLHNYPSGQYCNRKEVIEDYLKR